MFLKTNFRYLCYYAANDEGGKHSIGVAVASSPWGPYEDIGGPIVAQNWNCVACFIDPSYFRDTQTSKHYLLWKGDTMVLNDTFLTLEPSVIMLSLQFPTNPSAIYLQELDVNGTSFKEDSEAKIILETDK